MEEYYYVWPPTICGKQVSFWSPTKTQILVGLEGLNSRCRLNTYGHLEEGVPLWRPSINWKSKSNKVSDDGQVTLPIPLTNCSDTSKLAGGQQHAGLTLKILQVINHGLFFNTMYVTGDQP